jgi:cobalt-zinc-cadmium efflux system membrane fusion protein
MTWFSLLALMGCGSVADHHEPDVHGAHEAGVVELTPEAVAAARIVVAPAREGALTDGLSLPARIALDPRKEAVVSAWIAGQVDTIAVRPGEEVTRGQTLARVQSPDLGEAVAAFRTAKARDDAADARLERLRRLEADGVSSRAQVLEAEADHAEAEGALEAAEERLRILDVPLDVGDPHKGEHFPSRVPVRSPIAGTVLTADVSVGERVDPGQSLFHVGDLDEIWLMLDVYERDLASVREGQTVRFSVEAYPEQVFEGPVAQVGDWIEPDARTVEVRVVVPNPDHKLKPNMFATAELSVDREKPEVGVILPADAVQRHDGAEVVFVEEEPGHFTRRPVVVAERTSAKVRLGSGLSAGERVVTEGAFALRSELEKGELGDGHAH